MGTIYKLEKIPMPPSDNALKRPVSFYSKHKRAIVKTFADSFEYKKYKSELDICFCKNIVYYNTFADLFVDFEKNGLSIICDFYFFKHNVFCKNGTIKKMDVSNRLKATLDAVSFLTGIDDRYYKNLTINKKTTLEEKEYVDITIIQTL